VILAKRKFGYIPLQNSIFFNKSAKIILGMDVGVSLEVDEQKLSLVIQSFG